jgi:hypothetical protein
MNAKDTKKENDLIAEAYSRLSEDHHDDEIERDDHARSTAGLSPFSSTHEDDGWPVTDTVEFHSDDIIELAAEFIGKDMFHPKVNQWGDLFEDIRDDVGGWIIHELQKKGVLGKHLDYTAHEDEYEEMKAGVDGFLENHFEEIRDKFEDKDTSGNKDDVDRPDIESHEDPNDPFGDTPDRFEGGSPASPRDREVARRARLGSAYRPDEENLDFQARDRD